MFKLLLFNTTYLCLKIRKTIKLTSQNQQNEQIRSFNPRKKKLKLEKQIPMTPPFLILRKNKLFMINES